MDADVIVWLFFIAIWLISSVIRQIRKIGGIERPAPEVVEEAERTRTARPARPQPKPAPSGDDVLRELMKQLGVDVEPQPVEQPVPSEHRRTASEHRRTPGEMGPTALERQHTPSEQRRTPSETRPTAAEQRRTAAEHRVTVSEHRRGDAIGAIELPPIPARPALAPAAGRRRKRSHVRGAVRRDLRRGGSSLARAFVLRELLGPPVALQPPIRDRRS